MLGLDKNKKYLLACSYGPDSMALFKLLLTEGYTFEVAHVNYNLREESTQEMKDLQAFCNRISIKLHILEVKKNTIKSNLEEVCRNIRYNFFSSIYKGFDALLVAHNQDDLIETYLLQKNRNSIVSFYGLKDINVLDGMKVVRPLLAIPKVELQEYCDENNVPYSIDKTNLEDEHERNRIRHEIVQKMSKDDRNLIINEINKENELQNELFNKLSNENLQNIAVLKGFDDKSLAIALHIEARKQVPGIEFSMARVKEIRKILESDKPNVKLYFYENFVLLKEYDHLRFAFELDQPKFSYVLEVPGELDTPYFYLNFTNGAKDRNIENSDYPLTIRNGNNEDVYIIKGYKKTLRRLFIDWKVPKFTRKRYPVIVNKLGEIKYIPRYRANFEVNEQLNFYLK